MALNAKVRRSEWIANVQNNPDFAATYLKGSLIMKHPSLIDFREKSDKANICNKRYETTKDRAIRLEKEQQNAILEKLEYRQDDPLRKYFYRSRQNLKEVQPPLRYQPRDKMERIKQTIDTNQRVNLEQLNNKMLHFPVFNEDERQKWITKNGISMEGFKVQNTALWKEVQNNNEAGLSPFLGGLQEIADKLTIRPRLIHKELSQSPFSSTIAQDPWRNKLIQSNSLRSMKTLKASLDCLKTKNSVTFTLPELKMSKKQQDNSDRSIDDRSRNGSLEQAKTQKYFTNSNTNFYFGNHQKQESEPSQYLPTENQIESDRTIQATHPPVLGNFESPDKQESLDLQSSPLKKPLKVIKPHSKVVNINPIQNLMRKNDYQQTQSLKQVFVEWNSNPHLNIQNHDTSAYNNSYNANFSTVVEKLNDQHLTKKIYDQKLYFQSASSNVVKEKSHIFEGEKSYDTIQPANKNINSFNMTGNLFSNQTTQKSFNYPLKTKRMSVEDLKSEIEKQRLADMLTNTLIKKTSMKDLANQTLTNKEEQNDTTNLTHSQINKSNIYLNLPQKNSMKGSQSYKVLPGVSPISKDMMSTVYDNSHLTNLDKQYSKEFSFQRSPNNQSKFLNQNIAKKVLQRGNETQQQSPSQSIINEGSPVDLLKRKKAVAQMLDHFFK
eukprot:403374559